MFFFVQMKRRPPAPENEPLLIGQSAANSTGSTLGGNTSNSTSPIASKFHSTLHQSQQQQQSYQPQSHQPQSHQQQSNNNQPLRTRPAKPPTRTTKISQKLVVFPGQYPTEGKVTDVDSEYGGGGSGLGGLGGHIVQYSYDVAKEKEAERIRRLDKQELPRVTSYCTARSYKMDGLFQFLNGCQESNGAKPKRIDECIYTPFSIPPTIFEAGGTVGGRRSSPIKCMLFYYYYYY